MGRLPFGIELHQHRALITLHLLQESPPPALYGLAKGTTIKNQPKQTEVTAAVHDHGGREGEDKARQQHHDGYDGYGGYGFERTVIVPSPVSAWQLSTVAGLDSLL